MEQGESAGASQGRKQHFVVGGGNRHWSWEVGKALPVRILKVSKGSLSSPFPCPPFEWRAYLYLFWLKAALTDTKQAKAKHSFSNSCLFSWSSRRIWDFLSKSQHKDVWYQLFSARLWELPSHGTGEHQEHPCVPGRTPQIRAGSVAETTKEKQVGAQAQLVFPHLWKTCSSQQECVGWFGRRAELNAPETGGVAQVRSRFTLLVISQTEE